MKAPDTRATQGFRTRAAALVVVAALVAIAACAELALPAQAGHAIPKPTIVLVHGAFADASSFSGITQRLQRDGYEVLAPANPLRGILYDSAYLASFLATISGPVVLVGHSYAGAVISNVAASDPDVKALVFVAAFLPDAGQSASQTNANSKDVLLGPAALDARQFPLPGGGTGSEVYVKTDEFRSIFAADLSAETAAVLAASQRPIDPAAFGEPVSNAAWKTIPSWCLVPGQDRTIGTDAELEMATRAHCHTLEIDGSHLVMIARPGVVTRLIETAAKATGS